MRRLVLAVAVVTLTTLSPLETDISAVSQEIVVPHPATGAVMVQNRASAKSSLVAKTTSLNPKCETVDIEYKKFGVLERVRHASTKLINPQTAQQIEFVHSFSPDEIQALRKDNQDEFTRLLAANKLAIGKVDGTRLVLDKCDAPTLAAMISRLEVATKMGMGTDGAKRVHSVLVATGNGELAANKLGKTWIAP